MRSPFSAACRALEADSSLQTRTRRTGSGRRSKERSSRSTTSRSSSRSRSTRRSRTFGTTSRSSRPSSTARPSSGLATPASSVLATSSSVRPLLAAAPRALKTDSSLQTTTRRARSGMLRRMPSSRLSTSSSASRRSRRTRSFGTPWPPPSMIGLRVAASTALVSSSSVRPLLLVLSPAKLIFSSLQRRSTPPRARSTANGARRRTRSRFRSSGVREGARVDGERHLGYDLRGAEGCGLQEGCEECEGPCHEQGLEVRPLGESLL